MVGSLQASEVPFEMPVWREPSFAERVVDIRDFQDGPSDLNAISKAIAAAHALGGGRVLVPDGTWITGPIHLRSNVNLHLADGADVRFTTDHDAYRSSALADNPGVARVDAGSTHDRYLTYHQRGGVRLYGFSPQIYGYRVQNVAITGGGSFDGEGEAWWPWSPIRSGMNTLFDEGARQVPIERRTFGLTPDEDATRGGVRPPMFQTIESSDVLIDGPTFRDGPSWMLHPVLTDNVIVRNVRIEAPADSPNTDGIDPDMTRNVLIENVYIATGDDAIAIKAGRDQDALAAGGATEFVTIRDVTIGSGRAGIAIGSEISTTVRNILVERVDIANALRGIRLKSQDGRGGLLENVWIRDVTARNIGRAGEADQAVVNVTLRYRSYSAELGEAPTFRNINIHNVSGDGNAQAIELFGLDSSRIQDLRISDIDLVTQTGLTAFDLDGLVLSDVRLRHQTGASFYLNEASDTAITGSTAEGGGLLLDIVATRPQKLDFSGSVHGGGELLLRGDETFTLLFDETDAVAAADIWFKPQDAGHLVGMSASAAFADGRVVSAAPDAEGLLRLASGTDPIVRLTVDLTPGVGTADAAWVTIHVPEPGALQAAAALAVMAVAGARHRRPAGRDADCAPAASGDRAS